MRRERLRNFAVTPFFSPWPSIRRWKFKCWLPHVETNDPFYKWSPDNRWWSYTLIYASVFVKFGDLRYALRSGPSIRLKFEDELGFDIWNKDLNPPYKKGSGMHCETQIKIITKYCKAFLFWYVTLHYKTSRMSQCSILQYMAKTLDNSNFLILGACYIREIWYI